MKNKSKNTKAAFASMDDKVRKMRKTDPIQFDVLYNEWRRMREDAGRIYHPAGNWQLGGE